MMSVSLSARVSVVIASLLLVSAPALAQGTAQERSACIGDAFRFCASDIPDVPEIEKCLYRNRSHLTSACKAEFRPSEVRKTKLRKEHFR